MNCPNCHAYNPPGSKFCIGCGKELPANIPTHSTNSQAIARQTLGEQTVRSLLSLFVLYLFYRVLLRLSFVEQLSIPEVQLSGTQISTSLALIVALLVLFAYVRVVRDTWSRAYPIWQGVSGLIIALVYVVMLAMAFSAIRPTVNSLVTNSSDVNDILLALRLFAFLVALFVLGTAWRNFYLNTPRWLSNLNLNNPVIFTQNVACLNCGYLNSSELSHCNHCGEAIPHAPSTES